MTRTASPVRRAVDWALRSREDGRITLVQRPNAPLLVWGALALIRLVLRPEGGVRTVIEVAAALALAVWALLEVSSGVNPFRRALGAIVLVGLAGSALLG